MYPTVAWVSSNGLPGTAVKAKPPKHVAQPYMQSGSLGGGGGSKSSPSRKPKQQHEQVQVWACGITVFGMKLSGLDEV